MVFGIRQRAKNDRASESLSSGERTRHAILAHALKIAAREGLAALTIGRLAKELEMSKSGLFAHFLSMEALELATVEKAKKVFENAVLRPAQDSENGIARLWSLCDLWLSHIERRVFSGPYFFTGALFEYADRPGPVAKAIKNAMQDWLKALGEAVADAQEQKQIARVLPAKQISLDLNGRLVGAYCVYLLESGSSIREARSALLSRLRELVSTVIPARAFESVESWKKYLEMQH